MRISVLLAACAALLVGCSSAPGMETSADSIVQGKLSETGADDSRFLDLCSEEMFGWFSKRGLVPSTLIVPELNETGSGCSYEDDEHDFSLLSQPADPDGSTERWVHKVLESEGSPQVLSVGNHEGAYTVQPATEYRQDCRVVVPVYYGFLHVIGGPLSRFAQPMPRDCDAARTLAEDLVEYIDESFWQTLGGVLVE